MLVIADITCLDRIVNEFASFVENIWTKNSKIINIMVHSKSWWNTKCSRNLDVYRASKSLNDWKQFKRTVKNTKHSFFNLKIQEISNKKQGSWKLMSWVYKHKLPAIEVIKYNG